MILSWSRNRLLNWPVEPKRTVTTTPILKIPYDSPETPPITPHHPSLVRNLSPDLPETQTGDVIVVLVQWIGETGGPRGRYSWTPSSIE